MATGLLIFAATYVLIAVQRLPFIHLNRPAASLLGAVAMVACGVISLPQAYAAIDLDVLVFLLGLMLITGYLEVGGFFEWMADWLLRHARTPRRLLVGVVIGGGLLSALFVNDTVCLVTTPVLIAALHPSRVRPTPYLLGLAMGANVGSVLSVTGNPQNMLIGIWSGVTFADFALHLLPVGLGGLALTYVLLSRTFRAELARPFPERPVHVPLVLDRVLVARALGAFVVAAAGWLAGWSLPGVAITAGTLLVLVARRDPAYAIERVNWDLLLLFASLFVVMRGLEATGMVDAIDRHALVWIRGSSAWRDAAIVVGVMATLSNLISNVPAVVMWRNTVSSLPDPAFLWRVVAMSATFAGNLVLIGSVANLIVAEQAESRGVRIGWWEYARVGVPITLLTLGWGLVILVLTR